MKTRKTIVAGTALAALIGVPTAAVAVDDYVGTTPPEVEGTSFVRPVKVLGTQETRGPVLPVTGGDLAGLAAFGAAAIAIGTVLVRRGRTASVVA